MKNKSLLLGFAAAAFSLSSVAQDNLADLLPMQGKYEATWQSLNQWECPEWFRDAKFGIWAHWGPQCQPQRGDWYARNMYYPGEWQQRAHYEQYGDPKEFGFKDVIHAWKADKWQPDSLIQLYKSVGARYFMTLGNHHDNLDLWDSPYQPWNSVNMGPKQDIVGGWAKACERVGLPLGVSIHASHTWTWMEGAQDYDGKLTKADGQGQWWEGYDPQDLYEQRHERSRDSKNVGTIHSQWEWGNGASQPDAAYKQKFLNRTLDVISHYKPDLLYFDDTVLPFYPKSNEGLSIVQHMYNQSLKEHNGQMRAVVMGKKLETEHKQALLWDVERGVPDRAQELPWQTCTCIGSWHYDRGIYERGHYKSAPTVVYMLVDIVSKNGNLLLSVPLPGSGALDDKAYAVLMGIKQWMDVNNESIYGTRPWSVFGEGPSAEGANPLSAQGFNEGRTKYSAADIRYVQKGEKVYATALGEPKDGIIRLKAFASGAEHAPKKVKSVSLLGYGKLQFERNAEALTVQLPQDWKQSSSYCQGIAPVLEIK